MRAVLGKQSLQILSSHLETFRQGSSPIKRHIASFKDVVNALVIAGGPPYSSMKWYVSKFFQSVNPSLLESPCDLSAKTLDAAFRTVLKVSDTREVRESLSGQSPTLRQATGAATKFPPKTLRVGQQRLSFPGAVLSFDLHPNADPSVQGLARTLASATTSEEALMCMETFVSTSGDKRLFSAAAILQTDLPITEYCQEFAQEVSSGGKF